MEYIKQNEKAWDKYADEEQMWSQPVSKEEIEAARNGEWGIVLTPVKKIPREWFPESLENLNILCLASGGGQQGPILAAAGAKVVVFDNSAKQLSKDEFVANRDHLDIKTVQGDMKDLSVFEDEQFDLIIHPWSNCFIDSVLDVWNESYRVLKKGGSLLSGFGNPIEYIFDSEKIENGEFEVRHKIPYSDVTSLTKEEYQRLILDSNEAVCFGHTLEDQIGGQVKAGFVIAGFYEDIGGSKLNDYINSGIATKALKL